MEDNHYDSDRDDNDNDDSDAAILDLTDICNKSDVGDEEHENVVSI